ncbi:MAG: hypothetical protein ACYCT7_08705, partial [bacterium]
MINTYILISVLVLSLILIAINVYFVFIKSKKNEDDNKLLNKSLSEINSNLLRLKDAVEKSDSNIRNEIKTEFKNSRDETLS